MPLLAPTLILEGVEAITPELLKSMGIKALILDVDNTLTAHGSQELPENVKAWLADMRKANVQMMIASNNVAKRVKPFAKKINLPFEAFCIKPLPFKLMRIRKELAVKRSELALVGDQIFTDTLAANFYGICMLLVEPMQSDHLATIRLKRQLEKPFLTHYYKNGGKRITKNK
ncbi:MAG: YqeG family HAD IIIA-type phosphatase [Oscillospiraceae bacterium]